MLDVGGIPQGDYAPVPFLLSSRGWAAWIENDGHGVRCELGDEVILSTRAAAGPLKVHLFTHPTPAAQLRAFLRLTNSVPPVLPEWAYGFWKSRDIYRHQTEAEAEHAGFRDTASRSTRSCSTPPGPRNTTRGSSTRTSSRTPRGTSSACARTASAPWSGSRRG